MFNRLFLIVMILKAKKLKLVLKKHLIIFSTQSVSIKCTYQNRARKKNRKIRIHVGMNDKATTITPIGSNPSSNGVSILFWIRISKRCSLVE